MENFIKHFVRVGPGIWTCVRNGEFQSPNGRIQVTVGTTFTRGTNFMGMDVAQWLDEQYEKTKPRA
jgi:hypothetical protein